MNLTAADVFRDHIVKGVPSSNPHEPSKPDIRAWGTMLEGIANSSTIVKPTLAALQAVTPAAETNGGMVLTGSGAGLYYRAASAWVFGRGFPDSIAVLSDVAGTANVITANLDAGVSPSTVSLVVLVPDFTNTSTSVTIALNGGAAVAVKNATGGSVAIGDILANVPTLLYWTGAEWRQLFSSATGASMDHQGTYSGGTTYTRGQFVTGSDNKWYQLKVATATGVQPVGDVSGTWLKVLDELTVGDGAVTRAKLDSDVQESLDLADQLPGTGEARGFLQRNDDGDGFDAITKSRAAYELVTRKSIQIPDPRVRIGGSETGITYGSRVAKATCIGNLCFWTCDITLTSKGAATGDVTVDLGIPFSPFNNGMIDNATVTLDGTVGTINAVGYVVYDTTILTLRKVASGGTAGVNNTEITNTSNIRASGHFFVSLGGINNRDHVVGQVVPEGGAHPWPMFCQAPNGHILMSYLRTGDDIPIYESSDGGWTWQEIGNVNLDSGYTFLSVDADDRVMAAVYENVSTVGFSRSLDNGRTWSARVNITSKPADTWHYGPVVHAPLSGKLLYCTYLYPGLVDTGDDFEQYLMTRDYANDAAAWTVHTIPLPADGNTGGTEAAVIEIAANTYFMVIRADEVNPADGTNANRHDGGYWTVTTNGGTSWTTPAPLGNQTAYGDELRMPLLWKLRDGSVLLTYRWQESGSAPFPGVYRRITFAGSTPTIGARTPVLPDCNSAPFVFEFDDQWSALCQMYGPSANFEDYVSRKNISAVI